MNKYTPHINSLWYHTQPKAIHIDLKDIVRGFIYSSHNNHWSEEGSKNHLREFLTASQWWARWYAKEIAKSLSKYIYMKTDEVTE